MTAAVQVSSFVAKYERHSKISVNVAPANGALRCTARCWALTKPAHVICAGKAFVVHVSPDATVLKLKTKIMAASKILPEQQRLVFAGRQLEDGQTLSQCGVAQQTTVHLLHRSACFRRTCFACR